MYYSNILAFYDVTLTFSYLDPISAKYRTFLTEPYSINCLDNIILTTFVVFSKTFSQFQIIILFIYKCFYLYINKKKVSES